MTVAYQRAATAASGWEAWGTLVYGTTRIALRKLVVFGGIAVLFLTLLLRTGEAGVGQLWASALLAIPLLAVGSLTRTVGLRLLGRLLLIGAALMGVMYLLGVIVITPLLDEISRPRDFVVPALEQLLVLLPLVVLVWRWRDGIAWSLGATDLLLAGVAVGIGFGLVEHAYLRIDSAYLDWLPVVGYHPLRLTPGHAIWAGLGGATLGLGLLLRSRGRIWLAVAASGSLLAFLDHAANNNTNWGDGLSGLLNAITLNGWLAVVVFLGLAAACIGADLSVQRRMDVVPHRTMPSRAPGLAGLREAWRFLTLRRRLAIAEFHWRRLPEAISDAGVEAGSLDELLYVLQPAPFGEQPTAAASIPSRPPVSTSETEAATGRVDRPLPPTSGGGDVSVIVLIAIGGGIGTLAALGSQVATPILGSLALTLLDVGANCDPACLASGAGGAGGSGGPSEGRDNQRDADREKRYREQQENFRKFDDWLRTKSVEDSNWQPREERIRLYNEYKEGKRPWPWPHGPERIRRIDASQTTSARG